MSKFKEIELDTGLEKVFSATDTLVAHLSRELGRTEVECIIAMVSWLEDRQKTQYCRIAVPKTEATIAAALVLEDAGITFDTYGTTDGDPSLFLVTIELYEGDRQPIRQVHDVISAAVDDDKNLMDIFDVAMYSSVQDFYEDMYQHPKHVDYSKQTRH